jgi:hypothetical protein
MAYGALVATLPLLFSECRDPWTYVILAAFGACYGRLLGAWFRGSAHRPGWSRRLVGLGSAGTLFVFANSLAESALSQEGEPSLAGWETWIGGLIFGAVFGGLPAALLWSLAERSECRPGWGWWLLRGLGAWLCSLLLASFLFTYFFEFANGLSFRSFMYWFPFMLVWIVTFVSPGTVAMPLATTLGLAFVAAMDQRRRSAGPPGPAPSHAPVAPLPRPPAEPAGPGLLQAVPAIA